MCVIKSQNAAAGMRRVHRSARPPLSAQRQDRHCQHKGKTATVSTKARPPLSAQRQDRHCQHKGKTATVSTKARPPLSAQRQDRHCQHKGKTATVSTKARPPLSAQRHGLGQSKQTYTPSVEGTEQTTGRPLRPKN